MSEYQELAERVIEEFIEAKGEYADYRRDRDGNPFLLVEDWDEVTELNDIFGEELLKLGAITQEEFDEVKKDNTRERFLDMVVDRWGFTDEYVVCDTCYRIVPRIVHSYLYNVVLTDDDEWLCADCARENPEYYVEYLLGEGETPRINMYLDEATLKGLGFVKLEEEYETGMYDKFDDPDEVKKQLKDKYRDIILSSTSASPFAVEWVVFVREPIGE